MQPEEFTIDSEGWKLEGKGDILRKHPKGAVEA